MSFLEGVRVRAAAARRRIIFPESSDSRTLDAVAFLARDKIVDPVLVLDPARPETHRAVRALASSAIEVLDPATDSRATRIAAELFALRSSKGLTEARASALAASPLYFADGLVRRGEVDGCVAGATHTTAEVLRAALWLVGAAPGVRTVSSSFYMVTPPFRETSSPEVLTFTDCAVVPYPTAAQIADIALAAAEDRRRIVGDAPLVALLSFSTRGSGAGP